MWSFMFVAEVLTCPSLLLGVMNTWHPRLVLICCRISGFKLLGELVAELLLELWTHRCLITTSGGKSKETEHCYQSFLFWPPTRSGLALLMFSSCLLTGSVYCSVETRRVFTAFLMKNNQEIKIWAEKKLKWSIKLRKTVDLDDNYHFGWLF